MSINVNQLPSVLRSQYDEWASRYVKNSNSGIVTSDKSYNVLVLSSNQLVTHCDTLCKEIFKGNQLNAVSKITEESPEKEIKVIVHLRKELKEEKRLEEEKIFNPYASSVLNTIKADILPYDIFDCTVKPIVLDFCHQKRKKNHWEDECIFDHFVFNGEIIR